MNIESLIIELEKVINYYKLPNANFFSSSYNSQKEAIDDMTLIMNALKNNDNDALDRLSFLFAPTGTIQEISIDSGWSDEYLKISDKVDVIVGRIRQAQKTDTAAQG